jgi:hypothetical protein
MRLVSARVINYKPFRDSGDINFSATFNTFIGQNDVGKSALMEALSLNRGAAPHRSVASAPRADDPNSPNSVVEVTYQLSADFLSRQYARQDIVNLPEILGGNRATTEAMQEAFMLALKSGDAFSVVWESRGPDSAPLATAGFLHSLKHFEHTSSYAQFRNTQSPSSINLWRTNNQGGHPYFVSLANCLRECTYGFRAERLYLATVGTTGSEVLKSDASNLGDVLNNMSTDDPYLYVKFLGYVRAIFPHITEIKPVFKPSKEIEVRVGTAAPELSRRDLSVSLANSGTGIGQVLAMLYVVVRNQDTRIILIDEPQSFLHPGAVRKLIEILRIHSQHQYFVTTHSPAALNISEGDKLFHVARGESESVVSLVTRSDELKSALADVGVRLSDVFGAESVMWVEGATEEVCFPHLISRLAGTPLQGTVVLGVVNTGDFDNGRAERVLSVYERLSNTTSLLPQAVGFIFDSELRTGREMQELSNRGRGKVHWLPFRMFENYLLQPDAITHLINSIDRERPCPIEKEEVIEWLRRHGCEPAYLPKHSSAEYGQPEWEQVVHGAKVLNGVLSGMTENRYVYDKVRHGEMLTLFLVDHPSEKLRELATMLGDLVTKK